jgi:hypothetical protein
MATLFSPPPIFDLPVSKGSDLAFTLIYKPMVVDEDGNPVLDGQGNRQFAVADYPDGAAVSLAIDTTDPASPVTADATIVGSEASFLVDWTVADTFKARWLWRAVLTVGEVDTVIVNGAVARFDGKS